nr:glucans biosynthesis protein MdoC [Frankia canadensis]
MGRAARDAHGQGAHYYHLDGLRGTFMLVGVFVHVSTLGHDRVFHGIAFASGLFRMQGFFLISGFLSAMLVGKYGAARTVRRRFAAVGTPLVCTFVLFNPPTLWMTYNFHNDPNISFQDFLRGRTIPHPEGELHWPLHLWFLISLLCYVLCTPPAVMLLTRLVRLPLYQRATVSRSPAMAVIVLGVLAFTIVLHGFRRAVAEPVLGTGAVGEIARMTLQHLPFYCLGLLLYLDRRRLLAHFQRPAPILLVASGLVVLAGNRGWIAQAGYGTGQVLSETVFSTALVSALLALGARLVPGPRAWVSYLADSAYTVYLFHFFWIYIVANLLGLDTSLAWPQMLLVTALVIGITLAIHQFVIARSAFLRTMFNGKFPARKGDARPASRHARRPVADAARPTPHDDPENTLPLSILRPLPTPDPTADSWADAERTQQLRWLPW